MKHFGIQMHEFCRVEMRRRAADFLEREFARQRIVRVAQFDRVGRAGLGEVTGQRQRLDAFLLAQ
jgi:hypothetical protein